MNILEIISGKEVNGAIVHCMLLSKELVKRGHSVTLLCRYNAKIINLLDDTEIEVIESDMNRWPLKELRHVSEMAHERKIDILHTHMTRAHNFGVFLSRFSHIPCIATAHSHIVQPHWMFADHVIAVSDCTRRFQQRRNFVRQERIETVHGFTDYNQLNDVPDTARNAVRASLGIEENTPLIGIIGDIIPRKGHLYLIRALPLILIAEPNARLVVIGDAKRNIGKRYYKRVQAEAERLNVADKIIWAGYRSDIPEVLKALDVYALASLDEMFPVALLEAMVAGVPIVATAVGGIPECLTSGENGLLVPKADPAALATAISQMLCNPVLGAALSGRAQMAVREQFSLQSQAPRIEAIFNRIIKNSG